jgi:uncharacterized protein
VLRLSNYSIAVALDADQSLLVHGYSGAWDIVTADTADGLKRYRHGDPFKPLIGRPFAEDPPRSADARDLAPETIELLVRRGHLTEKTGEEERQEVALLAGELHGMARMAPPAFVFTISYACNLACEYCFQDKLRADPAYAPKLATMSLDMVDRIFAAMPAIEARHGMTGEGPRNRRITLFGGEPLLARHRPVVEHILARAREQGAPEISAVTNGTQIDAYLDLLGPGGISFLQITLDGPPRQHDTRRIGPDRAPTFDRIARNIDLALETGTQVKLRINVDRTNGTALPELAETIDRRGWFGHPNFSAYAIPVHESSGSGHDACGFGSWQLTKELEALAHEHPLVNWIEGPDAPWQRRVREIIRGSRDPLLSLQPSFCGAHTQTWVFDAFGDIYACWERAGYEKERIGRLAEDGSLAMTAREAAWRERTVASNPVCGRCPYAFYCGGGCALLAEHKSGNLHSNYCDGFSQRFKALATAEVRGLLAREAIEAAIVNGMTA